MFKLPARIANLATQAEAPHERMRSARAKPLEAKRSEPIKAERSDGPHQHAERKSLALLAYAKARRTAQPKRASPNFGFALRPFALVTFIWASK